MATTTSGDLKDGYSRFGTKKATAAVAGKVAVLRHCIWVDYEVGDTRVTGRHLWPIAMARAMLFRTRELLIGQRTQLVNALRGHLAEHGHLAPVGLGHVARLSAILGQKDNTLPDLVRDLGRLYLDQIAQLTERIEALDERMTDEAKRSTVATRLRRMPGIGPVTAMAIETFAPDMTSSPARATSPPGSSTF